MMSYTTCQRNIFSRSCVRIAEEVQLQAEEEWIVEALKKIKQQRNCLQIEQLHLESLKAKLNAPSTSKAEEREQYNQHISAVNLMNPALGSMHKPENQDTVEKDALCNDVELDLMVSNSKPMFVMSQQPSPYSYDMEEDDEDDDEDEDDDGENVMIDINMLMNGTSDHFSS